MMNASELRMTLVRRAVAEEEVEGEERERMRRRSMGV